MARSRNLAFFARPWPAPRLTKADLKFGQLCQSTMDSAARPLKQSSDNNRVGWAICVDLSQVEVVRR
jgi:hypothetical protein